jgi:hypothetical protein
VPQLIIRTTDQELWVIVKFVNSRWFRGKFQLKVHWEDQEDQDDCHDHETIVREATTWREQLVVEELPEMVPVVHLCEEYYARHPGPQDMMIPLTDVLDHQGLRQLYDPCKDA